VIMKVVDYFYFITLGANLIFRNIHYMFQYVSAIVKFFFSPLTISSPKQSYPLIIYQFYQYPLMLFSGY